uniref:helix-turn-helix domain-containing protein n=1 Tax=Gordonia sp. B7-2 TaxID=3420932 RepID=UPI003D8FAF05
MTGPIPDGQKMLFLTTRDVAARWSISERQVREMAQAGEIPAMKLGKLWRFPLDRLERFERAAVAAELVKMSV